MLQAYRHRIKTMLDTLIKNATIVDGTGSAPYTGDIGIADGIIDIGREVDNVCR